jgi:parallel beta-helix repeat protein
MTNKAASGTVMNDSAGDWVTRVLQSFPSSYAIWQDGVTCRAETNKDGLDDYSGTNSTTVIDAAISACSAGDTIYIQPGVTITSAITADKHIVFKGQLTASGAIYGFTVTDDITFEDFVYTAATGYGLNITDAATVTIKNSEFTCDFYAVRVNTPNTVTLKIFNSYLYSNGTTSPTRNAVYITDCGASSEVYIKNSLLTGGFNKALGKALVILDFSNNTVKDGYAAFYLDSVNHVNVSDNIFIDCAVSVPSTQGVLFFQNRGTTYSIKICGNIIYFNSSFTATNTTNGIVLSGENGITPVTQAVISDNFLYSALSGGVPITNINAAIYLHGYDTSNRNVESVTITGNHVYGFAEGIVTTYSTDCVVSANVVQYVGTYGIHVDGSTNILVVANDVHDNSLEAGSHDAIYFNAVTTCVRNYNKGYITEAHGTTGAIATGTAVNHGLATTPTAVIVSAAESGPTDIYVDTVGAASFEINFGGGGNKTFYWRAYV